MEPVAITAICILAAESVCYGVGIGWKNRPAETVQNTADNQNAIVTEVLPSEESADEQSASGEEISDETVLSLWTDDAPAKIQLTEYMAAITSETGADYIQCH